MSRPMQGREHEETGSVEETTERPQNQLADAIAATLKQRSSPLVRNVITQLESSTGDYDGSLLARFVYLLGKQHFPNPDFDASLQRISPRIADLLLKDPVASDKLSELLGELTDA